MLLGDVDDKAVLVFKGNPALHYFVRGFIEENQLLFQVGLLLCKGQTHLLDVELVVVLSVFDCGVDDEVDSQSYSLIFVFQNIVQKDLFCSQFEVLFQLPGELGLDFLDLTLLQVLQIFLLQVEHIGETGFRKIDHVRILQNFLQVLEVPLLREFLLLDSLVLLCLSQKQRVVFLIVKNLDLLLI